MHLTLWAEPAVTFFPGAHDKIAGIYEELFFGLNETKVNRLDDLPFAGESIKYQILLLISGI